MLKKLLIFSLVILVFVLATVVAGIYLVAEDTPLVTEKVKLLDADREILQQLIEQNRPGAVIKSDQKNLRLTAKQLNQLLQYASDRIYPDLSSYVIPDTNRLRVRISYRLPGNPVGKYLNAQATLRIQFAKYMVVEQLKLGQLSVPPVVVTILQPMLLDEFTQRHKDYVGLWKYLRRIDLSREGAIVHYRLERSDLAQVRKVSRKILVNTETKNQVIAYTGELNRLLESFQTTKQPLIHLLKPMFAYARKQSEKTQNVVAENKMLLLVLGMYMSGKNPEKFVMEQPQHQLKNIGFTLAEREDLAQHYIISAAINALSSTRWSSQIGLEKEIDDSKTGSGFSFVDLMADIAGNKLAQTAMDIKRAAKLQEMLSMIENEEVIFGRINGLQEGLTENEFRLEYGTTNSDEYIAVVREIERRLFRCIAYR